jgi:hypothetical protein
MIGSCGLDPYHHHDLFNIASYSIDSSSNRKLSRYLAWVMIGDHMICKVTTVQTWLSNGLLSGLSILQDKPKVALQKFSSTTNKFHL